MATLEDYGYQPAQLRPMACLSTAWETVKPRYWLFVGINLVAALIYGSILLLMGPMLIGIFHCLDKARAEKEVEFSDSFVGFQSPHIGPLILFSVIYGAVFFAIYLLTYFGMIFAMMAIIQPAAVGSSGGEAEVAAMGMSVMFGGACCMLGVFSLLGFVGMYWTCFAGMLVFDRQVPMGEAMGLGMKLVFRHFWPLLGLSILASLFYMLGILACYVGAIFVLPVVMGAPWAAYRTFFPDNVDRDLMPQRPVPPELPAS
jgi:uncharacterized membrane protein